MRHGNLPVALEPSREKDGNFLRYGNFLRFCHSIFGLGSHFQWKSDWLLACHWLRIGTSFERNRRLNTWPGVYFVKSLSKIIWHDS